MPSYHWRETAVILIYSIGAPFSFMRMPQGGGAACSQRRRVQRALLLPRLAA
jgi:hypothetical protein